MIKLSQSTDVLRLFGIFVENVHDWQRILNRYNFLYLVEPEFVVVLNSSVALFFSVGVVGNFDVTDSDHTTVAKGFPQQVNNEVR